MRIILRCGLIVFTGLFAICFLNAPQVSGQSLVQLQTTPSPALMNESPAKAVDDSKDDAIRLTTLEDAVRQQQAQLEELRKLLIEQQETIKLLSARLAAPPVNAKRETLATTSGADKEVAGEVSIAAQTPSVEDRLKKVEGRIAEISSIKFSGDIRLRSESFFGLSNNLATGNSPTALGNELSPRHRMRVRARFTLRGSIGNEFDWGLRFATSRSRTLSSAAATRSREATALVLRTLRPKATFCSTVMCGKSE